jgi:hypothetical protein
MEQNTTRPVRAAAIGGPGPVRARLLYGPCDGAVVQARAEPDGRPPGGLSVVRDDPEPFDYEGALDALRAASPEESPEAVHKPCLEIPVPSAWHNYRLLFGEDRHPVPWGTAWLYVWASHRGPVYAPPVL